MHLQKRLFFPVQHKKILLQLKDFYSETNTLLIPVDVHAQQLGQKFVKNLAVSGNGSALRAVKFGMQIDVRKPSKIGQNEFTSKKEEMMTFRNGVKCMSFCSEVLKLTDADADGFG